MLKTINFFDGYTSASQPELVAMLIGSLVRYSSTAEYEADQDLIGGSAFFNTTLNVAQVYSGSEWQVVAVTADLPKARWDLEGEFAIANNQSAPANVTDFILDSLLGEFARVDYTITRHHSGPDLIMRESGNFDLYYNPISLEWEISGETYSGGGADVDFSMNGNQVQYVSSDISGTIDNSSLRFFLKYE